MDKRILIVEDEASINDILMRALKPLGYDIRQCYSGEEARLQFASFSPHLVLLDVMLPDCTGFKLSSEFSKESFIIMITARDDISDKLRGMDMGADDYITKPFDIREVKGRVKMVLRRSEKGKGEEVKGLYINEERREVLKDGEEIILNRKEFDLLYILYKNKNKVFSRNELLDRVWGVDFFGDDRTVDVHIRRIRGKLNEDREESLIDTVFGVGYVMRDKK